MEEPTDPSDWGFHPLVDLDGLLRCPICFDYFNIAVMMPKCSHNYCSLCIRRYLKVKPQCPTCSSPVVESQLQCNRLLDELVQCFKNNRKDFMHLVHNTSSSVRKNGLTEPSTPVPHKQPLSNVKFDKKRKSSKSGSEKDDKMAVQCPTKTTQCTSKGKIDPVVLDSPTIARVQPTREKVGRPDGSSVPKRGSGSPHLVPEPPRMSQLDFEESQFSCNQDVMEEHIQFGSSKRNVGVVAAEVHGDNMEVESASTAAQTSQSDCRVVTEREKTSRKPLELGTPTVNTTKTVTPQLSLPVTDMKQDSSFTATQASSGSIRARSSSFLGTPSRTPVGKLKAGLSPTAHNSSAPPNINVSTPGPRGDAGGSERSTPSVSNKKVNCPVCGVAVFERFVNSHLDLCLNQPPSTQDQPISRLSHQLPKLPKLIWSIMKDRELRKKCKDYHLPTQGNRSVLVDRIKEFTLQYNAQRDSLNPKTMKEIAQDVERAEKGKLSIKKATAPSTPVGSQAGRRKSSTAEVEQSRKKYVAANDSHFSELIANIKKRGGCKKETPPVVVEGDVPPPQQQCNTPSSSRVESIGEPSYSPVEVEGGEEPVQEGCDGAISDTEGEGEEEVFAPESPELLSKGRYTTRSCETVVVPESPSAPTPRKSLTRAKRKLTSYDREEQSRRHQEDDPDFLPVTPYHSRKKQRKY